VTSGIEYQGYSPQRKNFRNSAGKGSKAIRRTKAPKGRQVK
jgi:hypothetical protein